MSLSFINCVYSCIYKIIAGVSVDSTFKFGWTPLMYAASVSNVELMQILLNRGSNASFDKGKPQ